MEKLIVTDDFLSQTSEDYTYTWLGYEERDNQKSLLKLIENDADYFREKYLGFIYQLGETYLKDEKISHFFKTKKGNLWWMSLLVEKSSFKSPRILDCLRMLALEKVILENKPKVVLYIGADKLVAEAIRELCVDLDISFQLKLLSRKSSFSLKTIYNFLPMPIKAMIYLVRHAITRFPLTKAKRPKWHVGERSVFIFSNLFNIDMKKADEGEFYSRQWEELPNLLRAQGYDINFIHHFLYSPDISNAKHANVLVEKFNANTKLTDAHVMLDNYLSIGLMLKVFIHWLKFYFKMPSHRLIVSAFKINNSHISFWKFLKCDWYNSFIGPVSIMNLLWIELYEEALSNLPKQQLGLYLCENQDWEWGFNRAWRNHNNGKLIGVVHSTVRFWDLRYFFDKKTLLANDIDSLPLPDLFAINGEKAKSFFLAAHYPEHILSEVEASRFQYLLKLKKVQRNNNGKKSLLILGNFTFDQTVKMILIVDRAVKESGLDINITFKPHPVCHVPLKDFTKLDIKIDTRPLVEMVSDYDYAFSGNTTSAGLDAHLAGVKTIIFLDDKDVNFSPLRGTTDVSFICNSREFITELNSLGNKNENAKDHFFYLDSNFPRWKQLIARNLK